ncbi:MAG: DUF5313 family protein [Mycobacteriaceae bacterium]
MTTTKRPHPLQWVGYVYGKPLPPSCRQWVANDLTGDHAVSRHLFRSVFSFLPIFGAFLLLPGPFHLRAATVLLALFLAVFFSMVYMYPNRARRLQKHGLDPNLQNLKKQQETETTRINYEKMFPPR